MSSCFNCETPVSPQDRFCGNCGIALQSPGGGARAQVSEGVPSSNNADLLDAGDSSSPSGELQPTLIESSFGGSVGGAAAAARAHEPVQASEDLAPSSKNLNDELSASQNLSSASQNLSS